MRDFEEIKQSYQELIAELSDPEIVSDPEKFEQLAKEKAKLEIIMAKKDSLDQIEKQIRENETIISAREDQELLSLALEEQKIFSERKQALQAELEKQIEELEDLQKVPEEKTAVIMEIRAGVGGEEAALFAKDLFQMYSCFAKSQNWQASVLDTSATEIGGFKEIVFELKPGAKKNQNSDIFSLMKHEAGVHRVQRIPDTEKSGRVHTSTITVAVLKKSKEIRDFKINQSDLKIDFFNATGPGGQNVNKRKTAVRITHLPSGIVVTSRVERNQLQNKENAMSVLAAKLLDMKKDEQDSKISGSRKSQIGGAKRSEKIRTYNFPQDRVTDHRLKKSWHHLEEILKGKIEPIINALQKNV